MPDPTYVREAMYCFVALIMLALVLPLPTEVQDNEAPNDEDSPTESW